LAVPEPTPALVIRHDHLWRPPGSFLSRISVRVRDLGPSSFRRHRATDNTTHRFAVAVTEAADRRNHPCAGQTMADACYANVNNFAPGRKLYDALSQ
jgi:hypothetical protein